MSRNTITALMAVANGRWLSILNGLGLSICGHKHQPCPVCGGKDRFRFDDKDGRGTWFCNQCEPNCGDGLALVSHAFGVKPYQAACMVAPLVGLDMGQTIDETKLAQQQQRAEAQQRQQQQQVLIKQQQAAKLANDIARKYCQIAPQDNGYLQTKNVKPFGSLQLKQTVKVNGKPLDAGTLVIPVFTLIGLSSLQFITADGRKTFLAGGQIKGGMFPLCDRVIADGVIYIGEGFATCAAVAEDRPLSHVICAFNARGLVGGALAVRRSRPHAEIIILADNDRSGAGEHYAKMAAIAANGSYIMPRAC